MAVGDETALAALMSRYERPLYAFLVRHVGAGADADDLFQETWIRVARHAGRYDPARPFTTWLFQIAVNLCRDRARRRAARPEEVHADPAGDAGTVAAGDDPEQSFVRAERAADVRTALAALPDAQREVVLLRYHHELSEEEVAAIAGIPRGTVKSRLHAALKRLRALLQANES